MLTQGHTYVEAPPIQETHYENDYLDYFIQSITVAQETNQNATSELVVGK